MFDEAARALFGERTGKGYQLADRVEVRLVEVAPLAGAMRFEMLSEPKPLPGSKRSFHKAKGQKFRERALAAARPRQEMTMEDTGFRRRASFRPAGPAAVDGDAERVSRPDARIAARARLFSSFLEDRRTQCEHCGEEMHHHRADDLPAYLVIVIVGHIVVGAFMDVRGDEHAVDLAAPGDLGAADHRSVRWRCCRPVKGAVVGLQWALYMHGFGGEDEPLETHPEL